MDKARQSKIAAFLESVEVENAFVSTEAESFIMDCAMGGTDPMMGVRKNGGDCTNSTPDCNNSRNGGNCSNTENKCNGTENKGNCSDKRDPSRPDDGVGN